MATVYLGLGASLGDRLNNLQTALDRLIEVSGGVRIVSISPVYESPHFGLEPGDEERFPPHLNCVACVDTSLSPSELLARIQAVEEMGGRQREVKWGPRTIDIDLLLYDDLSIRTETLTVPHPGLMRRAFVLVPLADIAPDLKLPDGRTIGTHLLEFGAATEELKPYPKSLRIGSCEHGK